MQPVVNNREEFWQANKLVGELKSHPKWKEIRLRAANGEDTILLSKEMSMLLPDDCDPEVERLVEHLMQQEISAIAH